MKGAKQSMLGAALASVGLWALGVVPVRANPNASLEQGMNGTVQVSQEAVELVGNSQFEAGREKALEAFEKAVQAEGGKSAVLASLSSGKNLDLSRSDPSELTKLIEIPNVPVPAAQKSQEKGLKAKLAKLIPAPAKKLFGGPIIAVAVIAAAVALFVTAALTGMALPAGMTFGMVVLAVILAAFKGKKNS